MKQRTIYKPFVYAESDTIMTAPEHSGEDYTVGEVVQVVDTLGNEVARWEVVSFENGIIEGVVRGARV